MQTDFNSSCANMSETISGMIGGIKNMIVAVNEVAPTNPPVGTVDEAQAEVLANLDLALRHLEDASTRVQSASHAYGDTKVSTGTAVEQKTEETGEEE